MMILANNGPGLVVYGVAYYELEPPYICTYNSPQFEGHKPEQFMLTSTEMQSPASFIDIDEQETTALTSGGYGTAYYSMACDTKTVCASGSDQNTALISYRIDKDSIYYI